MSAAVTKMQLTDDIAAALAHVDSLVLGTRASATADGSNSDDDEADVFVDAQWPEPVCNTLEMPPRSTKRLHSTAS